ncbi:MAG TPA: DUF3349 domain-containing protein [Nocardioides sp.]|uniref:DUF3349 domain-containing protein n=1 Tax=Nocardioides sp. TaxID=35761 RepID=UPI002C74452D|nr:DUF3349 domain-containing protein [Nocardioides sp.]HQR26321.1 DUF3349 domain-containing protein [Nocardioides sp.]
MSRAAALDRVLGWVRAAYPDGVPPEDHAALLRVLDEHLSGDQLAAVATLLGSRPAPTAPEDVARVAARLVAAGWPLADPVGEVPGEDGTVLQRALGGVVAWLRAGYPEGVPDRDYIPLVAILERRLTKREVKAITRELKANGLLSPDQSDIEDAIAHQINEPPTQEDIARVTEHLRKKGWPVEFD